VRSSNPVLSRLGQVATQERATGGGYGIYPGAAPGYAPPVGRTMTLDDVVVRTVALVALTGISGAASWLLLPSGPVLALAVFGSMIAGMVLGLVIAVPIGVLSATRQDKASDYVGRVVAISGLSLPDFWLGTLVITFAAIWFHWIPPIGYTSLWESPWRNLQQFLLPAAVLGFRLSAATMRMTRSTVLEVLREDYVRTAWAKGLGGRVVVYKHALKNALIPVVTIVGGQLGTLLAGTVVVETIFALPGMGRLTVEAILFRDYPVVQNLTMFIAVVVVLANLAVDLLYAWADPRIKYEKA